MDDVRTIDQKKADQDLEDAIRNCLKVYDMADEDELVADYVVLMSTNKLYPDGVVKTRYPMLFSDGDIPWYRALGLIETHRTLAKIAMSVGNDNG